MFVELHLLQNFAPSNLNRDDTGAPKDCEFGGYRRARISSQCLKRAIRRDAGFERFLAGRGGVRTRRLILEVAQRISDQRPVPANVVQVVSDVFKEGGIERPTAPNSDAERDTTKLILFMDRPAVDEIAARFKERWQELARGDREARDTAVKELGEILVQAVKAPDIALFGRMVEVDANRPFGKLQLRVDAASQVAHALSTNRVSMEFDFYTAVDDLLPEQERGAGMMGTVEFNSACFYRYADVDVEQLKANLGRDEDLARGTVEAFIRASVAAIPTGKQNSMAAQNSPSFVFAVVRRTGLWSLANAFTRPIRPDENRDLVQNSIRALDRFWGQLTTMYGDADIVGKWLCMLGADELEHLRDARLENIDRLVERVAGAVAFDSGVVEAKA